MNIQIEASENGFYFKLEFAEVASIVRFSRHVELGGGPRERPGGMPRDPPEALLKTEEE